MARRKTRVTITASGRDKGKTFELLEMAADQAERWATRAGLALTAAGSRMPEGFFDGSAGLELSIRNLVLTGLQALQGLRESDVRPLMDELKPYMTWCPPGNAPPQPIFPGDDSQVEEFTTWYTLYFEYLQLLLGFSLAAGISTLATAPPPSA